MDNRDFMKPDSKFAKEVIDLGGGSLKKCFQCGTCSAVCALSPDEGPFPRKEMIWAQWGLKDRLLRDPDVWLCHQCTDCSAYCPRDAKPGDVLAAIRRYAIVHFAFPSLLARALSTPRYLLAFLALPALLLLAFLGVTGNLSFPEGEIVFHEFIPMLHGEIGMMVIVAFVVSVATIGAFRFWRGLNKFGTNPTPPPVTRAGLATSFVSSMVEILKHSKFGKCQVNRISHYTHLAIFYGFILLMLSAFIAAIYHYAGTDSPYSQTSPVKVVGHAGAVLLLAGCMLAIFRRLSKSSSVGNSTYFDWFLIVTLFFVTVSGVAVEAVRLAELAAASYWLYLVHLWLMFALLIYAPFSKGAHLIYRTLAITYAKQIGREVEKPSGFRVES